MQRSSEVQVCKPVQTQERMKETRNTAASISTMINASCFCIHEAGYYKCVIPRFSAVPPQRDSCSTCHWQFEAMVARAGRRGGGQGEKLASNARQVKARVFVFGVFCYQDALLLRQGGVIENLHAGHVSNNRQTFTQSSQPCQLFHGLATRYEYQQIHQKFVHMTNARA